MGILHGDIHSSSIKSMFYTETAGAAWPSVKDVFDNQMHTPQHRASEIKWQEARGCHKQNWIFVSSDLHNWQLIRQAES